jgi:hypothetical protein
MKVNVQGNRPQSSSLRFERGHDLKLLCGRERAVAQLEHADFEPADAREPGQLALGDAE